MCLHGFVYTFLTIVTVGLLATSGEISLTWTSPIIPKLHSNDSEVNPFEEPITENQESWIGSLVNIGAMIGPFPYGYIAKNFGRKCGLLSIAIPQIISYLTLAFARSVGWYYFARILGGIALGGGYTLLPMYVAEIAEDNNRGQLSATLNIFWTFGSFLPYVIGPYTSIACFNIILTFIPATFFVLFLLVGCETPHYLVAKNKVIEAAASLKQFRCVAEKSVEEEVSYIKACLDKERNKANLSVLLYSETYKKGLRISLFLIVAQQLSGVNAVLFYTEEIFISAGINDIVTPEVSSIITGLFFFISSFILPFLADRTGRRLPLLVSCFGTALANVTFGIFFYLKTETSVDVDVIYWLPLTSLVVAIVMLNIGLGPLPWTISSELFPTSVKPLAASLVSFACWTTSFFVTKFFNNFNHLLGQGGTFWLFGSVCFVAGVFTLVCVPETKGRSFDEIQEILKA